MFHKKKSYTTLFIIKKIELKLIKVVFDSYNFPFYIQILTNLKLCLLTHFFHIKLYHAWFIHINNFLFK